MLWFNAGSSFVQNTLKARNKFWQFMCLSGSPIISFSSQLFPQVPCKDRILGSGAKIEGIL
jgi:hypothetical protein